MTLTKLLFNKKKKEEENKINFYHHRKIEKERNTHTHSHSSEQTNHESSSIKTMKVSFYNLKFILGLLVVWWVVGKANAKIYQISKLTTNSAVRVDSMLMPCHNNNENKLKCNQKVVIKVWMDLKV